MPKLLIATTVPKTIEAFLLPYALHFRTLGWEVDALTGGRLSSTAAQCFRRVHHAPWSRTLLHPANALSAPRFVRTLCHRERYDVVHTHTAVASFITRYSLRTLRAELHSRVVYTAHGFHFNTATAVGAGTAIRSLERLAGRWTDRLIVINDEDQLAARHYGIAPSASIVRMPGIGLDLEAYSAARVRVRDVTDVREALGIAPSDAYFLVVGEFSKRKRQTDVVRALARLRSLARHLHLPHIVFAGVGAQEQEAKRLAAALALDDHSHFLGFRSDIPTLIRGATALILPSSMEGLPRCVLEAMALGVPVIGSDVKGTAELLSAGCGVLFPFGNVDALADSMDRVILRPDLARAIANRALERVRNYDLAALLRMHEQLYSELISDKCPGASVAPCAPRQACSDGERESSP